MDALRGIPFKAICVVGLDAASGFPGTVQLDEFDLMGLPGLKRRGDRDSRRDNRNIFFDLIMSARSWVLGLLRRGTGEGAASPAL